MQRLYGAFWTDEHGRLLWALHRNGRSVRRQARPLRALVVSMPLPSKEARMWDAPTFRHCADRVECDWRPRPV
jgi:hypothetical protein